MTDSHRDTSLPADWPVKHALDAYCSENGFTLAAYDEPRTEGSFLGFRFTVPNTPHHRWAIMLHDLHHVATGFGTDPAGEGEMGAWELRRGIRPLGLYTGSIVTAAVLMGLIVAPRRVLRAWQASGGAGGSLFHERTRSYGEILSLSLGELRELLKIPADGLAQARRGLHSRAPSR